MIGSFYRSRNFLSRESMLYLYKSQIRPKMEYCSRIWSDASLQSRLLGRLQNRMKGLVGYDLFSTLQSLSHWRNVANLSLFYRYYFGKCAKELHDLVPKRQEFARNTRYDDSSCKHPEFLRIPNIRRKFHEQSFFPRTASL